MGDTEVAERTFVGNPDPPAQTPRTGKSVSVSSAASEVSPRAPAPDSSDEKTAFPKAMFRVVNGSDGNRDVYMLTDDMQSTRLGKVTVPDAQHVLDTVGQYNENTRSWDVPESAARSLMAGKLAFPDAVAAQIAGGEAGVVRSYNALKLLKGESTLEDVAQRNHTELLKTQLAAGGQPAAAWSNGLGSMVAEALKHPLDTLVSAMQLPVKEAASFLPMALEVAKGAAKGAAFVGGPALTAGMATGTAVAPPVAAGIGAALSAGAVVGSAKTLIDLETGTIAADMIDQGYDEKTIKEYATVGGAVKGMLWMTGFKFLPQMAKASVLTALAQSDTLQMATANFLIKHMGEVAAGTTVMVAQEKVRQILNNMAAEAKNKPENLISDPEGHQLLMDAGIRGAAGMAGLGAASAGMEVMGMRAESAREAASAKEMTTTLEMREKTKVSESAEQSAAGERYAPQSDQESRQPGISEGVSSGPDKSVADNSAKVKAQPILEEFAKKEGRDPNDPKFAEELYERARKDTDENIKPMLGMAPEAGAKDVLTPEERAAAKAKIEAMTPEQKADITRRLMENARIQGALEDHITDLRSATKESAEDQMHELVTGYKKGEVPPEKVLEGADKVAEEKPTLETKTRNVEERARIRALKSELADQGRLIDELSNVRRTYLEKKIPTRLLDDKLNALVKQEASTRSDLDFYESGKGNKLVTKNEKLSMKPPTLENIINEGFKEGKKEYKRRAQEILDVVSANKLTQADVRKLIKNKNIGLMGDVEFNHWLEGGDREINGETKHQVGFKEQVASLVERKQALRELNEVRHDRKIVHEQYVRQLNEFPSIHKMTTDQLREYASVLSEYDKGDEALSPARVKALEGSDLEGVKTTGEARKRAAEMTGRPIEDFRNLKPPLSAAATPDPQLRNWQPGLKPLIDLSHQMTERGKMLAEGVKDQLNKLWADAIAERHDQMDIGGRAADFIAPQQRDVMRYVEDPTPENAAKLTPAELKVAEFWKQFAGGAEDYLIKKGNLEEATRFSGKYAPHVSRDFFEVMRDLKEVGLKKSLEDLLPRGETSEFSDQRGNFLGFNKFFKQALFRSGEIEPSKNMAKAMSSYVDDFYNKLTQDQIAPVLDTLARAMRPEDGDLKGAQALSSAVESFTKMYANNKKGINNAGGVIDALAAPALQFARTLANIHYIQAYYALQVTVAAVKMLPGEFMALGTDLGVAKMRKYTAEGKALLENYSAFVGKGAFEEAMEPGSGLKDWIELLGGGVFSFAHKTALEDVLLGSVTKEELKSGVVSDKRLAEIKLQAGRWLDMEGMSSIAGSTQIGRTATQMKRWAVPPTLTISEDLSALKAKVTEGKALTPEQAKDFMRLGALASFAAMSGSVLKKEMEDDSFMGHMIHYIRNDIHGMWAGLDPKFFFTTPVGPAYVFKLAADVSLLAHLEEYQKKEGYKGADALARDLKPAFVKQVTPKNE